jgi:hypothetical protein
VFVVLFLFGFTNVYSSREQIYEQLSMQITKGADMGMWAEVQIATENRKIMD